MLANDTAAKRPKLTNVGLSEETKKKYGFVVGIDFGTTFSGVAYSRVGDVDGRGNPVIDEISQWPMRGNRATNQAPTRLLYAGGVIKEWGHQNVNAPIPQGATNLTMFKLHLDESQTVNIPPLPAGVTVVQAISDYLKAIFGHACKMIEKNLGTCDVSKLRFCLTVPAVWTESAKITMREAAIQAGIVSEIDPQDRLLLVGEPEAAALYCETFLEQYDLQNNDTFLICDAGGGTIDLVLYRVRIEEDGTRSLIEEVAGEGGMCGSVTLDARFREFIESLFAQLDGILMPLMPGELDGIVKNFANSIKSNIYDENDPEFSLDVITVELPPRYFNTKSCRISNTISLENNKFFISPLEFKDRIFEPVINQILKLVDNQVQKVDKLDAIFLVGGFGQSAYLYSKLKAKFQKDVRLVCTPARGEMAIVRGAVLMGINPRYVKQRVVRRTYGYECALEFEPGLDPESLKTMTEDDGDFYCNKRFLQYALKGDVRDIDYYAETSFACYYGRNPKLNLFAFDGDRDKIPRHTTDKNVKKIIEFEIELPNLPDRGPKDLIEITVKFYLYQTEIKIEVDIEGQTRIYTGSYRAKRKPLLGSVNGSKSDLDLAAEGMDDLNLRNSEATFGSKVIETSYDEDDKPTTLEESEDEELGLQGYIPE